MPRVRRAEPGADGQGIVETRKKPQVFSGTAKPEGRCHCPSSSQRCNGLSWTMHLVQAPRKAGSGFVVLKPQAAPDNLKVPPQGTFAAPVSRRQQPSGSCRAKLLPPAPRPQALFSSAPQGWPRIHPKLAQAQGVSLLSNGNVFI